MANKARCATLTFAALTAALALQPTPAVHAADAPPINLGSAVQLQPQYVGAGGSIQPLATGQVRVLSLAAEDFDGDGIGDLAAGYAVNGGGGRVVFFRGSLDAFAPQSQQSLDAIARGDYLAPFLDGAPVTDLPSVPDFLAAGRFIGAGGPALLAAARGGNQVHVLARGVSGALEIRQTISVPGTISALTAYDLHVGGYTEALIGVRTDAGPQLLVYTGSNEGLVPVTAIALANEATSFAFGNLDGDSVPDVLFVAGGQAWILHGATQALEPVRTSFQVAAAELGSFLFDREALLQMALLSTDGTLHILAHNAIDSRPLAPRELAARRLSTLLRKQGPAPAPVLPRRNFGWKEVESFPGAGVPDAAGSPPLMFRTRISNYGADDILILGSGTLSVVAHADSNPASGLVLNRTDLAGNAVAALSVRVSADGHPGLVFLKHGGTAPFVMRPRQSPGGSFTVNTTSDGVHAGACAAATANQCTLREAILEANALGSASTITVPAGTYSLTIGRGVTQVYSGNTGALYVNQSVTIVGSGSGNTVIQWGTPGSGTTDLLMAINQDVASSTNATASLSNLTLSGGQNHGTLGVDGDGGCLEFDTGSSGTATLNLTNVTVTGCSTTAGNGGGIAIFNIANHAGSVTITNSIIQNNSATQASGVATGGGIWVADNAQLTMTGSQVLNNSAGKANNQSVGPPASGGGITVFTPGNNTNQTSIHSSVISGNTATGFGGGIYTTAKMLVDQGSSITGNTAGAASSASLGGGGIYMNVESPNTITLTGVTITGNTATGNGGGIATGNDTGGGTLTMSFSRLAGNTATSGSANLFNDNTTVTATNNWWGTNAPATTIVNANAGVTTFDPFIFLTHKASPATIKINESVTLTADMAHDSHGSAIGTSNLTALTGLPLTFGNPVLGTIPQAQPESFDSNFQATATFNAGNTAGKGAATATVDQAAVPVNFASVAGATETGTTVTITTAAVHGFAAGQWVTMAGVGVSGYNGTLSIASVPSLTTFTYTAASGLAVSSGGTATVGLTILQPPSVSTSFSPVKVAVNAASTKTISITNGNTVPISASFTDTLPSGLVVAATPSVTSTCGGTLTANAGAGSISFSNTALATGTCSIQVNVSSATDNLYTNSVTVQAAAAGDSIAASASLTVFNQPHITSSFVAASIPLGGTTSLTFTLNNPNVNLQLTSVGFNAADALTAGLLVASPNALSNTCGGTATAVAGSGTVNLTGVTLAAGASCTFSINVTGTTGGAKSSSVTVTSLEAGDGNTSTASLTVVAAPTISQAFSLSSIPVGGTATLTFTIVNPNVATGNLTGVGFSNTLPSTTGTLVVASAPNVSNNCGGAVTANAGAGSITFSGGAVAHDSSCTISVDVKGTAPGDAANTTGQIGSTEGGTGVASNTATLKVVAPPTISKAFGASVVLLNGTVTLTFTISNPSANTTSANGIAFSDALPGGLLVASAPNVSSTCGGTVTANAGTASIGLSGGSIAAPGGTCTISVDVTATQTGSLSNTTGAISSTNGGTGQPSNTAILQVGNPPQILKAFGAATVPLGGTTSLSFTLTNPNAGLQLTGVGFSAADTLPAGLLVASSNNLSNNCGGVATAVGGSGSVNLTGVTLAAGASCTLSIAVQGTTAGAKSSSVTVTSAVFGVGNTSTAGLTVVAPPSISKSFGASSMALGGTTTLTFTITNPNATAVGDLTGLAFTDSLPSTTGTIVVANVPNVSNTCGGTVTANAGAGAISLSGGSVAHNSSCTVSVSVRGTAAGDAANVTGNINSTQGGQGGTAAATVAVVAPPSIAKSFGAASIIVNATTSLTFTITNPPANTAALAGVSFTDSLPAGLTVATGATSTCGGNLTTAYPASIALAGASIGIGGTCQFNVTVTGATAGTYTNTTGAVSSANGGTGNTASAGLSVLAGTTTTTLASSLNPTTFGQSVTFTATVSGLNGTPTGTVTFAVDGVSIGSATLSGGTASVSSSTLAVGTRAVTASYSGDSTSLASTSSTLNQVVSLAGTNVALVPSLNPSQLGQSVTFTATVTPQAGSGTPTSTVTFKDGVVVIGSASLSGGVAALNTSSLTSGPHSITAVYSGDAHFSPATSAIVTQNVQKLTPTVGLTSSVNPSVTGQFTSFTATVSGSGATPSGTVTVNDGGSSIGTITLAGGSGSITLALTGTGSTRNITAQYNGDGSYAAATSPTVVQTVNPATTTLTVAASSNPALSGSSVTFTAAIAVTSPGQGTPTGSITFSDGANSLGSGALSGGVATFTTSALSAGTHNITASYAGTVAFAASASPQLNQTISSTGTAVVLTSSANPSVLGQSITLTARVTASGGTTPWGSVTFFNGASQLGSPVTLDLTGSGTASLVVSSLPSGTSTLTAAYSSTNGLSGSTSGPLSQVVLVPVTVQASPLTAQFTVDGTLYTGSQTFNWIAGSPHALGAPSPQSTSPTSQLAYSGWSDAGAAGHTVTAPSGAATYTVSFATQYLVQVNLNPALGGSATGGGFYSAGATANLNATANSGYKFTSWSGGVTGASSSVSFTVTAPLVIAANFTPLAPSLGATISARTDGTDPGTRNITVALTNNGAGPAYNTQVTAVTSITVLTGSGAVTLASGVPGPVPGATLSASGGSTTVPLVFNWPTTATRVSITFRMTATDPSGTTTYPFTQTVTIFR